MQTKSTYTREELADYNDEELLLLLKKSWGFLENASITVMGEIRATYNAALDIYHYRIYEIKGPNGLYLKYPIHDLSPKNNIYESGIYTQSSFRASKEIKAYINAGGNPKITYCELILASPSERKKHNNPLLLCAISDTIKILDKIKNINIIKDEHGNILIEESVVNYYTELNIQKIKAKLRVFELETYEIKTKLEFTQNKYLEEENELKRLRENLKEEFEKQKISHETKLTELKINHDNIIQKMNTQEAKKQKSLDKLEENKKLIVKEIKSRKHEINELTIKIQEIREILQNEEDIMGKKLEKLRAFIKDKADILLDLEFIDQDEFDNLLMLHQESEENEQFVDFENDLQSDKQKAISHIQAYLFKKDIIYPRYILEDFLALIQTNDLIILAGESGSGKTNLIKSFAEAIGGKFEVIPIKPNWTSSEDLLGYYNPLEKKYLATPFLEALLKAKNNPEIPYFICLDEMNLARVEYYFADFLSLLEERGKQPKITLYSEDESSYVNSEIKMVISLIESAKDKFNKNNLNSFVELLEDKEINQELKRIFGFSDKDSLIKYHSDLKRMLSGVLGTPASIVFPSNVRIIGAINIDETTHYLSPKILDRAHIMKFDSPLLQDWDDIEQEIENVNNKDLKIKFRIEDLGRREDYPKFKRDNEFCKIIIEMTENYFKPLGIEVGLRTIRQGLNYQEIFIKQGSSEGLVINNFILHKILPKMTFDGSKSVEKNVTKKDVLLALKVKLESIINREDIEDKGIYVIDEINNIVENAKSNDEIVNYWA